ncbi:MAG: DUF2202 domain-containing protein [Anaerolineales bacterium]|nr:DUF2202 domain-containing protein [Anaerolineales bacterium]
MLRNWIVLSLVGMIALILSACTGQTAAGAAPLGLGAQVVSSDQGAQVDAGQTGNRYGGGGQDGQQSGTQEILNGVVSEDSAIDLAALDTALSGIAAGDLSTEESEGLSYMREEEKLAHDVYMFLYDLWGLPIFQNIAASEQTHSDAVLALLERYGLPDPASGNGEGVFSDPDLQALYSQLTQQGSLSLGEALTVGAAIEEIDILDLQSRLSQTDQPDIQMVYQNLEAGSENHLRAFVNTLQSQTGETYQPQYLSQEAYDAILSAQAGRGGQAGGGQGQGNGKGRGGQGGGQGGGSQGGLTP